MTGIQRQNNEDCVSEVVGEMLMIGLAIILISVFASVAGNFLPSAHDPVITILVTNDTLGNATLWHKGGDWVRADELEVIVGDDEFRPKFHYNRTYTDPEDQFLLVPAKDTFDLGSSITIRGKLALNRDFGRNDTISLVTPRARIFSGAIFT